MVRIWILILFLGVLALRMWYYTTSLHKYKTGNQITITTTILDTPINKLGGKYLMISGIDIKIPKNFMVTIGDRIKVIGSLETTLTNDKRKLFVLNDANFYKIGSEDSLRVQIAKLRVMVQESIQYYIKGDEGGLAAGILVGGSEKLSNEAKLSFQRVGLTHILAASGYNLTVVASWMELILGRWLNKFLVMYFGIVSIVLYISLAGGGAAVVRAGIMVSLTMVGKIFGRESDAAWLLLVTSMFMLIWQPAWFWDVGFQLSFAAMIGIIYFAGKSVISQTLACQITTLPLILHYFGNLSLIAPLANVLFLWPVPILMPVLAIGTLVNLVNPVGGGIILVAKPLLEYMTKGIEWFASLNFASISVEKVNFSWVIVYYVLLFIIRRYANWSRC